MPELPEVETIVRELQNKIINEIFSEFVPLWPGSFLGDRFLTLKRRQIIEISRTGKYILFKLDEGYLVTHLRMTGQLIVKNSLPDNQQHLRLIFKFESGKYLLFYDLRKFGRMYHTNKPEKILENIGIDALNKNLDIKKFKEILKNKKTLVKPFLLNQKYIAGFGNIYIDESLFRAQIHPETKLSDLSSALLIKLFTESRRVLLEAIARMGSTISNYKTTGGGFGTNQNYFRVYQRKGLPCFVCDTPIKKIKVAGRGTHFCPNCQKKMKN
jgi:formamidopyrimidine-DNA glycosylase